MSTHNNPTPSNTTQSLVELLLQRDQAGQRKYGTSLDRADLAPEDWAQHAIEEALDLAGYLSRFGQTVQALKSENLRLAEENVRLRAMLAPILELARTLDVEPAPAPQQAIPGLPCKICGAILIPTNHSMICPTDGCSGPFRVHTNLPAPPVITDLPAHMVEAPAQKEEPPPAPKATKTIIPLPAGCIGAVEAAQRMKVARNTICGWVGKGHLSWAGEYTTPAGNPGKYVRLSDLDAMPAKLAQIEEERKRKAAEALKAMPTAERSQMVKDALTKKRDAERPEGGVSYAEAAKFLGLSPDSVRLYAQRGILERIGETPYVTRASVVARKKNVSGGQKPTFDINETGRLEAIEEGKAFFRSDRFFSLARKTVGTAYQWLVIARGADPKGGEIIEHFTLNGLGQWESTPHLSTEVGYMTGTRIGSNRVAVLG